MEESDFLQWITRIQALRDEHDGTTAGNAVDENEDIAQDLIAAFRYSEYHIQLAILGCAKQDAHYGYVCALYYSRVFDRDGNGFITRDELRTAMEMMQETVTEAQVNEMLQIADLDKDGKINYEGMTTIDITNMRRFWHATVSLKSN